MLAVCPDPTLRAMILEVIEDVTEAFEQALGPPATPSSADDPHDPA